MKEKLISLETAKLAKEKGFDWNVDRFYNIEGRLQNLVIDIDVISIDDNITEYNVLKLNYNNLTDKQKETLSSCSDFYSSSGTISAPTQSLLQKWLREKHNLHIDIVAALVPIDPNYDKNDRHPLLKCDGKFFSNVIDLSQENREKGLGSSSITTYEQSLEESLVKALKLIKL